MSSLRAIVIVIGVVNILVGLWLPAARHADLPHTQDILHDWLDARVVDGSVTVRPDLKQHPLQGLALKIERETDVESVAAGIIMGVQGLVLVGCGMILGRTTRPVANSPPAA